MGIIQQGGVGVPPMCGEDFFGKGKVGKFFHSEGIEIFIPLPIKSCIILELENLISTLF